MATTGIHFWSTTAATNASADSAVNWAEGQAPSSVNDSARALMASAKKTYLDISGNITTAGTSTAYTATSNQVFATAAAMSGALLCFIPHTTSGAAPTLSVDGLTARNINISTGVSVASGALIVGTPYLVTYIHASTEFVLLQNLGVFGALSVASLAVTGAATVSGATTLGGTLAVASTSTHTGAATFASTVSVGGATTLVGTLAVSSTASFTGAASANALTSGTSITGATVAGNMVATQANMETATATNLLVTPGGQHFHPNMAKAWARFAADGTTVASRNISGIVQDSTGDWTVTIATDFSSSNYATVITAQDNNTNLLVRVSSQDAGSFTIKCVTLAGSDTDPDFISFACYGDL